MLLSMPTIYYFYKTKQMKNVMLTESFPRPRSRVPLPPLQKVLRLEKISPISASTISKEILVGTGGLTKIFTSIRL